MLIIKGLLEFNPCHPLLACARRCSLVSGTFELWATIRAAPTTEAENPGKLQIKKPDWVGAALVAARVHCILKIRFDPCLIRSIRVPSLYARANTDTPQIPINTSIFVLPQPIPYHQKLPDYTHRMAGRFAAIPHHLPETFAAPASCRTHPTNECFRF